MNLDLSDEETAALTANITGNDRYPFSERFRTLKAILGKLRREPAREPLPPPKVYAPPRAEKAARRPVVRTAACKRHPNLYHRGVQYGYGSKRT